MMKRAMMCLNLVRFDSFLIIQNEQRYLKGDKLKKLVDRMLADGSMEPIGITINSFKEEMIKYERRKNEEASLDLIAMLEFKVQELMH